MLLILCIRCLTSRISKHVALSYSDYHATSYLNINGVSLEVNTLNSAVNTAACNHLGTLCQSILELADFLLLLLLRTDHKEPHDSEDSYHHDEKTHAATTGSCLQY